MGLFDKIKEMKADHDAKKAAEAAELLALCNRLRQNEIFLKYADVLHDVLDDPSDKAINWATGHSPEEDRRNLAVILTPNDFGLVATFSFEQQYRDNDGKVRSRTLHDYNPIDVQTFAELGMQSLPKNKDVNTAVLETLTCRLKEISYLTMSRGTVISDAGDQRYSHDAVIISVSKAGLQGKRSAW